jgi:hypothetical protein
MSRPTVHGIEQVIGPIRGLGEHRDPASSAAQYDNEEPQPGENPCKDIGVFFLFSKKGPTSKHS